MFYSLSPITSSFVFPKKCVNGDAVEIRRACKIKIVGGKPGIVSYAYFYDNICNWQEVNIDKCGKGIATTLSCNKTPCSTGSAWFEEAQPLWIS